MNKFKISLCILILVVSVSGLAQTLNFKYGTSTVIDYRMLGFLGEDDSYAYASVLKTVKGKPRAFLNKYSIADYSLVKASEIKTPAPNGSDLSEPEKEFATCQSVKMIGQKIYAFYSFLDNQRGVNTLYAVEITGDGIPVDRASEIFALKDVNKKAGGYFYFAFSPNSESIGIMACPPGRLERNLSITVITLDKNLKTVLTKEIPSEKSHDLSSIKVDDHGNVLLSGSSEDLTGDEKKNAKGAKTKFELLTIASGSGTIYSHTVLFPDGKNEGYTSDCVMDFNSKGEVVCCGLIDLESSSAKTADGYFFTKFSVSQQEPLVSKVVPFTPSFYDRFIQDGKNKGSKLLQDFAIRKMMPTDDGGAYLEGEKFFWKGDGRCSGSVVLIKINADGSVAWENMILKEQPGDYNNGNYFRDIAFLAGDKLAIIYNDASENLGTKTIKDIVPVKKDFYSSEVVVKIFSADGQMQLEKFQQPAGLKLIFRPGDTYYDVTGVIYTMIFENGCKCHRFGSIRW